MTDRRKNAHQFVDNFVPGQAVCRKCQMPRRVIPGTERPDSNLGPSMYRIFYDQMLTAEPQFEYLIDDEWVRYSVLNYCRGR